MKPTQIIKVLLLVGIIGFSTYWFLTHYTLEDVEVYTGLQGKAKTNPLLAARRLIEAMGISASDTTLTDLQQKHPSTSGTIILDSDRLALSPEALQRLLTWVKNGGHLITRPNYSQLNEDEKNAKTDLLMQALQISVYHQEDDFVIPEDNEAFRLLSPENPALELLILLDPSFSLKSEKNNYQQLRQQNSVKILHGKLKQGQVTVFSDLEFLTNHNISTMDHAEVLWQILNWRVKPPSHVWLIRENTSTSLWQLLWRNASPVIISGSLLLLFWLFAASHRFGPLQLLPQPDRRRFMEHIEASGRYAWQNDQGNRLIEQLRTTLLQRVMQTHPHWTSLTHKQQTDYLSDRLTLPESRIETLLYGSNEDLNKAQFTAIVTELEHIRKQL